MDVLLEKLFKNKSQDEIATMLINLNRFQLNRKEHIKKYNRLRRIHAEVFDSMENYIIEKKYNINDYYDSIYDDIDKEIPELEIDLDFNDVDDRSILFIYKNYPKLTSLTEIYLQKNKFKNKEKVRIVLM